MQCGYVQLTKLSLLLIYNMYIHMHNTLLQISIVKIIHNSPKICAMLQMYLVWDMALKNQKSQKSEIWNCVQLHICCSYLYTYIHSSLQLHYISSAVSLYFPYDFCLYPGMSAVASYSIRYIPFLLTVIVSIVCYSLHR